MLNELAGWLGSDGPGGLCAVTGGPGSAREALLGRLAVGPVHEHGAATSHRAVDVAVHAAGKTTGQVSRQLVVGLGGGDATGADAARLVTDLGPAVSIVVDSVDAADQPADLAEELLGLVARCPRPAVRLLLGFGGQVPEMLRHVVVAELPPVPGQHGRGSAAGAPAGAAARMAKATALVAELAAAEDAVCDRYPQVASRIKGVRPPPVAATEALRIRLAVLRTAGATADARWWTTELGACERTAAKCLGEVREFLEGLDALLTKRNRLKDRLDLHRQQAANGGFEEDQRLNRYYRRARELLWRPPCDLDRTERAVHAYYQAILRREEGM